jgi:long-chain acyl-CoA synthetase
VRHQPVVELVAQHVARVNARLARYEEIRRWAILPRELTVEAGELTPSLKVRRRVIEQRYRDVLDELYADATTSPSPLSTLRA